MYNIVYSRNKFLNNKVILSISKINFFLFSDREYHAAQKFSGCFFSFMRISRILTFFETALKIIFSNFFLLNNALDVYFPSYVVFELKFFPFFQNGFIFNFFIFSFKFVFFKFKLLVIIIFSLKN
jgi:hypothetical protein